MTPVLVLIAGTFVPVTVLVSTYVSVGAGTSASVAVFVTISGFNGLITTLVCTGSTGGVFVWRCRRFNTDKMQLIKPQPGRTDTCDPSSKK